jgi:hypothetical protein
VTVVDLADTTPATRPLGCPVQYRRDPLSFSRAGKGKLSVACPNGCSVRLDLDLDLDPKQVRRRELRRYVHRIADSSFATGKLHLPPGAGFRRVQVKLTRAAVALLRRYHRRVRVTPQLRFTADGPERAGPAPHLVAKLRAG